MSDLKDSNDRDNASLIFFKNRGIEEFKLSKNNVQEPNFGDHTLRGIEKLTQPAPGKNLTTEEAYQKIKQLDAIQTSGIVDFGLERNQVLGSTFNVETLAAISGLMASNKESSEKTKELNEARTIGLWQLNLPPEQVFAPTFGMHTLIGMQVLISEKFANDYKKAFNFISGLDAAQTHGYVFDQLREGQVLDPNFGLHTVLGMDTLQEQGKAQTSLEAFHMLQGLNATQTKALLNQESYSLPNQNSTSSNTEKSPDLKVSKSLEGFTTPIVPNNYKRESSERINKETEKNNQEKKSRKPPKPGRG